MKRIKVEFEGKSKYSEESKRGQDAVDDADHPLDPDRAPLMVGWPELPLLYKVYMQKIHIYQPSGL